MEVMPGYKLTDAGVIPEDWNEAPLKGKISIAHGFPFASEHFASHGPYRLTTPGHFYEAGGFRDIAEKQKYYVGPVHSDYVLEPGDLIVAMTEQADGLLGSAAAIPPEHRYLHNQRLGRVRVLSPESERDYLAYVFNSQRYRAKVRETAAGTKVKHTSPEKLLAIPVPLPPPAEQRAIAAALGDTDTLLAALDRLIAKKRDLKQAAMQQLLTGQTRLPGCQGEWKVRQLGEVAEVVMGQSPSSSNYNTRGEGLPLIQGNADISGRKTIRRVFTKQVTKKGKVGDLLLSVRAPVGEVARATFDMCLGRGVCAVRFPNDFLYHYLVYLEPAWAKHSKGSTFESVNSADVKRVEIHLPADADEQIAVAAVLNDMDAELSTLEARRDKTRALKQGMMQELLTGRTRLV